jgi:hypothetical protein
MDEHQQIAVVLGATGRRGHEDRLGERRGPAERADLLGPAVEIVLDQPVGERVVRELLEFKGAGEGLDQIGGGRRVAVAVRQRDQPVVDPGELLRSVVEALHSGLPRGRVEGVAVQGGRAVRPQHPQRGPFTLPAPRQTTREFCAAFAGVDQRLEDWAYRRARRS